MLIILIIILAAVLLGFGLIVYVFSQKIAELKNDSGLGLLKADMQGITQQLAQSHANMNERLDHSSSRMQDTIQKQFGEAAKIIADVTNRLTKLDETNRRVVDVADELKTLQNVLQNPKQRGVLGEYYLQSVLENVLSPDRFELQYKFADGEIVDAIIKLDRGQILPVDSKFSLENYNRLVEETDKTRKEALTKLFKADLKNRIDETSKYIRPSEGTMDFAFMFIPSEAIYYDLLINKVGVAGASSRDLIEYAFRDKRVIIVSPTSFMAYLQTVLQGLRSLQIEGQAKEIQIRVGQLGQHLAAYEQFMQRLGGSLGTTVNHYNNAHRELKKIDKDVVKIADTSPVIEPLLVDKPQIEE